MRRRQHRSPTPFDVNLEVCHVDPNRQKAHHDAGSASTVDLMHHAHLAREGPLEHPDLRPAFDDVVPPA
jgi:hypothetical protein